MCNLSEKIVKIKKYIVILLHFYFLSAIMFRQDLYGGIDNV